MAEPAPDYCPRCSELQATLAELLACGIALDDPRMDYVEVQHPRCVLDDARAALARTPAAAATHLAALEECARVLAIVARDPGDPECGWEAVRAALDALRVG